MSRALAILAIGAAFVVGARIASSAPKFEGVPEELERRHKVLAGDLKKIRIATRDLNDIRAQIQSGHTYLNKTEREMRSKGRKDFHIFMERARNDTLETLALYERILELRTYVDPMEKLFGKKLYTLVTVEWTDMAIEDILDELSEAYGVTMVAKGEIDRRIEVSLAGEMTLQSILYYVESQWSVLATVQGKEIWFQVPPDEASADGDEKSDKKK